MAILRPYEQRPAAPSDDTQRDDTPVVDEQETQPPLRKGQTPKKGRPTRSRAEAEAERMQRLHPNLTKKEQRRANAQARSAAREAAWDRQQAAPERQLMRDYVDARWTITEFILPVMLVMIAISFAFARNVTVQMVVLVVMIALLVGWFANTWLMWRGYKRQALARVDRPNFRGVFMEMNSRMMTIRRFRRPLPRVDRGADV